MIWYRIFPLNTVKHIFYLRDFLLQGIFIQGIFHSWDFVLDILQGIWSWDFSTKPEETYLLPKGFFTLGIFYGTDRIFFS